MIAAAVALFAALSAFVVLPQHFSLHPGERIHYTVLEGAQFADCEFVIRNPDIVRKIAANVIEAVRPGRTELLLRTPTTERRVTIDVSGAPQAPMAAIPHAALKDISADEFLFVGHANLDGFDHTAAAKPGIDEQVAQAKKDGLRVVYFISEQYPDWYTADRQPDYAIISEGQEHQIRVRARRIVFTGGSFMFCLLRNAQMTLHSIAKYGLARNVTFVFPAKAIWVEDMWGPGEKRPYPAAMILLSSLFARRANDAEKYQAVVVPFLDRMINQFPVAKYPPNAPAPPLRELMQSWNIIVRFGDRFGRVYRRAESSKTLVIIFKDV